MNDFFILVRMSFPHLLSFRSHHFKYTFLEDVVRCLSLTSPLPSWSNSRHCLAIGEGPDPGWTNFIVSHSSGQSESSQIFLSGLTKKATEPLDCESLSLMCGESLSGMGEGEANSETWRKESRWCASLWISSAPLRPSPTWIVSSSLLLWATPIFAPFCMHVCSVTSVESDSLRPCGL